MSDTKSNSDVVLEQNVSASESDLEKWYFFRWTRDIKYCMGDELSE